LETSVVQYCRFDLIINIIEKKTAKNARKSKLPFLYWSLVNDHHLLSHQYYLAKVTKRAKKRQKIPDLTVNDLILPGVWSMTINIIFVKEPKWPKTPKIPDMTPP
jgi:hypothetical protein